MREKVLVWKSLHEGVPHRFACQVTVVELEDCNHAGFVPTPGASLKLPATYQWYGSTQQLVKWLPELL